MANTKPIAIVAIVIIVVAGAFAAWQLIGPSEPTIKIGLVYPFKYLLDLIWIVQLEWQSKK